jgi:glycosyltransferase involved in cell wall biosynthesis
MKFSFVICGYNEEKNLDVCLDACLKQDYNKKEYEIIYIDNNSTDSSLAIANTYPVTVLIEKKQGPSEARNCGIRHARGEIIVFLDSDTRIDSSYLKNCEEKIFVDSSVGAGVGRILPLNPSWISNFLGVSLLEGYPRFAYPKYLRAAPSCNLSIRRNVLEKTGYFLERLYSGRGVTRFSEDKELCERIGAAGYKIAFHPDAFIYHDNVSTFRGLCSVWIKGSRTRADMILLGKKDPFSLLFGFNLPLVYLGCIFLLLPFSTMAAGLFTVIACSALALLSVRALFETKLLIESIFIKPWMDGISLLVVNVAVVYYRLKRLYEAAI